MEQKSRNLHFFFHRQEVRMSHMEEDDGTTLLIDEMAVVPRNDDMVCIHEVNSAR
jgi:hypothetical protein